jgi:hypothetical protein
MARMQAPQPQAQPRGVRGGEQHEEKQR